MLRANRDPFVNQLQAYLDKHKVREAIEMFGSQEIRQRLANDSELMWDTIPVICSRLRTLNEFRFKTFGACQDMLLDLAHLCQPKEVLISLLAELENENINMDSDQNDINGNQSFAVSAGELKYQVDDSCFKAILKPLQHILIKLPNKRNETLKWVLSTLNNHILKIPVPKDHQLEQGDERLLLEGDLTIRRIHLVLPIYLDFLEAFVGDFKKSATSTEPKVEGAQVASNEDMVTAKSLPPQKDVLLKALTSLLYHPFMFLDLGLKNAKTPAENISGIGCSRIGDIGGSKKLPATREHKINNWSIESSSNALNNKPTPVANPANAICPLLRNPMMVHPSKSGSCQSPDFDDSLSSAVRTLELLSTLEPNLYKIYEQFDFASREDYGENEDQGSIRSLRQDDATHALGVAAYMTLGQHLYPTKFFVPAVYSPLYTLERHMPLVYILLERRESLAHEKGLILAESLVSQLDKCSLSSTFGDVLRKYPVEKSLINIMRFSSLKSNRQLALHVFKHFVTRFTVDGRYQLLYRTLAEPDQHTGVRGLALSLFKDLLANDIACPAYTGLRLHRFLRKAIFTCLPEISETDLIENNDTIMGTLNLLRFLCLKDPRTANVTKIWDIEDHVKKELLTPLRQAIDLSRAHFKVELTRIQEESVSMTAAQKKQKSDKQQLDIKILNQCKGDHGMYDLPDDHEKQVIQLALVKFDMMESVLVRVTELFE